MPKAFTKTDMKICYKQKNVEVGRTKAIYIRLADMVYPDGNTIKASAGLCHYANYERLCD